VEDLNTPKRLFWFIVAFVGAVGAMSGGVAVALTAVAPTDDGGRYQNLIGVFTDTFKASIAAFLGLLGGRGLRN